MMKNSGFVAVLAVCCTYPIWLVSGQNCTASDGPPYSHTCIFECVKDLYDIQYCTVCTLNTNPIKLAENDTLDSLLHYQFLRFDEKKGAVVSLPSCSNCGTAETAKDRIYEEYVQPSALLEFGDLAYNLTVKPHHAKVNHSSVQRVHELYTNLTERFDETKTWCVDVLGITQEYELFVNSTGDANVTSETSTPDIEATTPLPVSQSGETFVNRTVHHHPLNVSVGSVEYIDGDGESLNTTAVPEQTTASTTNRTSEARNITSESVNSTTRSTKSKGKLHDHHFSHSVAIVVIIASILLILLVTSVVILGVYIKHRRNLQITSSSTYVFDQHLK